VHPAVAPLASILRVNTDLLANCVVGVDEEAATRRVTPSSNNVAFLVAHLVESRHYLATILRAPLPSPLVPYLSGARSLDDIASLPSLEELLRAWEAISAHLAVQIERLDTPALSAPARQPLPGSGGAVLDNLAFLVQHDSYHIGQLALLRRQLGRPAMSYATAPRDPGRRGA
jgi:uncharacterized damage-inducible protein DinB